MEARALGTARVLILAMLLAAPTAVAIDLATHADRGAQAPAMPPACREENGTYSCAWHFNTTDSPARTSAIFDVPSFAKTLATVTVGLVGKDNGWTGDIIRASDVNGSISYP